MLSFAVLIAAAACSSGSPSAAKSASPSTSAASPPTSAPAKVKAKVATQRLDMGGTTILPSHTVVAYYGVPGTRAEGVLGDRPALAEFAHVKAAAKPFGTRSRPDVPAYELIADAESGDPQPSGAYFTRLPKATIQQYLTVVHKEHGLLILDIQPGRDDFLPLAKQLSPWLKDPDVSLGIDIEWKLYGNERPDEQIGHTSVGVINKVSAWLSKFVTTNHLPQKLLVIHEFSADEIRGSGRLDQRSGLAITLNMDGHGPPDEKFASYRLVAQRHGFPLGFKLFYKEDEHLLAPSRVLDLKPRPELIEYQ